MAAYGPLFSCQIQVGLVYWVQCSVSAPMKVMASLMYLAYRLFYWLCNTNAFEAALLMLRKQVIYESELNWAQARGMRFLEKEGYVEHDPGAPEVGGGPHWHITYGGYDQLEAWAKQQAACLHYDHDSYPVTELDFALAAWRAQ
jgi:hypothetical protein